MRRIVLLITICCQVFWVAAQKKAPKWMDKQRKAVVTVTTYGKDNQKKASGTGFFITETGEALSGYSLFKDAARATVTDADGKEYPVSRILGADELYDVIKFKVEVPKKAVFLPIAREPISQGATAYLMPYSTGKITKFGEGPVSEVSKLKEPFSYYKLSMALESGQVGAAGLDVLENENGLYYYDRMGDVIPNPELAALRAMPNVILTDHTAFYTYEDVKSMVRGVLESAAAFAEGSPSRHDVTNR